jgi:2'-5' RNA ligase
MRLFVALAISAEQRENVAALIDTLRAADPAPRWINPQNLHITLKFIGEIPQEKLDSLCDALTVVRTPDGFSVELLGLDFFPNERRPSVAWIGLRPAAPLVGLAGQIDRVLGTVGIPSEARPFVPHLTIARFKHTRLAAGLVAQFSKRQQQSFGSVNATEFHLMQSKLRAGGAEYTTLRSFPFAKVRTPD